MGKILVGETTKRVFRPFYNLYRRVTGSFKAKRALSSFSEIFLELGSGPKRGVGSWVTLDLVKGCDIYCNFLNPLPFPDNSVDKIYSSHLFEHFSYSEGQFLFSECYRVLKSGGKFLISVPDARIFVEAYLNSALPADFFNYPPAYNNTTKIDYLNYVAYLDGQHKYMFDKDNLLYLLNAQGFVNVGTREFDPELDNPKRRNHSLFAVGIKP